MSGRKRSEVLDLLSSARNIREQSLSNITNSITRMIDEIEVSQGNLKALKSSMKLAKMKISKDDASKYAAEIDGLSKKVSQLKSWSQSSEENIPGELKSEYQNILNAFSNIDRKADNLREAVRYNPHYCDSEYASASVLVNETRANKNKLFALQERAQMGAQISFQKLEEGKKNVELNGRIQSQFENIEIRVKADDNMALIDGEFGKINKDLAHKFANKEFGELTKEVENAKAMSASQLNSKAASLLKNITDVRNLVLDRKKEYDLKKAKAEKELKDLMATLSGIGFKDLQASIFEEKDITMSLFEFERKYCNFSSEDEFEKLKSQIEAEIKKEKFDEASKHAKEAQHILNESVRKATAQYEKMLKEKDIVCKIIEAVQKLSYDVNVEIIDDEIKNGYTLEAIAGDEIINFDRIAVDDEGNTVIDIDHQESVKGTCGNSVKNVMRAMQDEGIFITDIKKGATSMVYGGKATQGQTTLQREKKRM